MKKLLLATVACTLLATQVHADKLDDSFVEVPGLWCWSPETKNLDKAPKGWHTTIYTRIDASTKKRCNKTRGNGDWIYIDNNTGISGSEYTCVTVEGGDNDWQSVGHLEKFLSPSRRESDSVTASGHRRMERAGHGAEGLFRC